MDKNAEGVRANQIAVGHTRVVRHQMNPKQSAEGPDESKPTERAFVRGRNKRVRNHDHDAEYTKNYFRREAVQIADLFGVQGHHGWTRLSEIAVADEFFCGRAATAVCLAAGSGIAGRDTL